MHASVSMAEVQREFQAKPYGWRVLDVAATMARLLHQQKAVATYGGAALSLQDAKLPSYLAGKAGADKLSVAIKVHVPEATLRKARALLKDFAQVQDVPTDEDGLVRRAADILNNTLSELQNLQSTYYARGSYPGAAGVQAGIALMGELLAIHRTGDATAFLDALTGHEDALLGVADDLSEIRAFFPAQQRIFDEARALRELMNREGAYVAGDTAVQKELECINAILDDPRPYRRIAELTPAMKTITEAFDAVLDKRRRVVLDQVARIEADVKAYAQGKEGVADVLKGLDQQVLARRGEAQRASSPTDLDALSLRLTKLSTELYEKVDRAHDAWEAQQEAKRLQAERAATRVERPEGQKPVVVSRVPSAPAPASKPKDIVSLRASEVCPPKRLESDEEIDAYVERIRDTLKANLKGHDGIRLTTV